MYSNDLWLGNWLITTTTNKRSFSCLYGSSKFINLYGLIALQEAYIYRCAKAGSFLNRYPQHAGPVLCCTDRKQDLVSFKQLFTVDPCHTGHARLDVSTEVQVGKV